jgi:Flp pilus assembly protein TadG
MHAPTQPRARDASGQATVEAALVLPFVLLLLLAVVQVGVLVRAQVLVTHAAREAARAAAVDADDHDVTLAAQQATTLDPQHMSVTVTGRGQRGSEVTVRVGYRAPTDVPLIGALLGDVDLDGEATMRVE